MNKFSASIMLIMFSVLMLVGSANAAHNPTPHPAQNETQCGKAGGTFSRSGSTNTCVITEKDSTETVPASHPSGDWTVDVTTPGSTETYTSQGSTRTHTSTGGGDPVVTACYNKNGNSIENFEDNKHCQPAA